MSTVLELVHQLRDDGKLQPLLRQLDELANRVQIADFHNASNSCTAGAAARRGSSPTSTSAPSRTTRRLSTTEPSEEASGSSSGRSGPLGRRTHRYVNGVPLGVPPPSVDRVEDAQLPIPPTGFGDAGLLAPEGSHDWEALQSAVDEECSKFTAPSAKVTWKKWALNAANTSLVVSLFWWVVVVVFKPDHVMAQKLQAYAFGHFARQYISAVVSYRGVNKDLYTSLWQKVITAAVLNLLRQAYPRSANKFDEVFEKFVQTQITRWTAGSLPTDTHPSLYSLPGDRLPAALALLSAKDDDFPVPPPPPPLPDDPVVAETSGAVASATALGFHTVKPSPVMEYMLSLHGLEDTRTGGAALSGRRTDRVGGGMQKALRRPLDDAPEDDVSYAAMAKECKSKAQQAVNKYEESKRSAARDVAAIRRGWVSTREDIDAQVAGQTSLAARAKDISDRLAHYIENDCDRLLRETAVGIAPTSFPVQAPAAAALSGLRDEEGAGDVSGTRGAGKRGISAPASLPAYLASTSAQAGCLAGRVASSLDPVPKGPSSTRMMAAWSKMRSVEAGITTALGQGRHNSNDKAARIAALQRSALVQREGASAGMGVATISDGGGLGGGGNSGSGRGVGMWDTKKGRRGGLGSSGVIASDGQRVWRPSPIESQRGTQDTRIMKAARCIMRGMDLEVYK